MARDLSAEVRRVIVTFLNDAASKTQALLNGQRAYGPASPNKPAWPFVRVDLPTLVPAYDGCSDAQDYSFRIHGFAKGPDESASAALANAILVDLDGFEIDLAATPPAHLSDTVWTGTQHLRDTVETNGWHAAISVTCKVAG